MPFKEITPADITDNVFSRVGTDWMLITAGTPEDCNTMTASWGQLGILWGKNVATCYVRPHRYTFQFMEAQPRYSLTFFAPGQRRQALQLLGSKSGRDGNKIAEAGLQVEAFGPHGVPAFVEAAAVLVCRKLYAQDLDPACFIDTAIDASTYPDKDYHRMYVGEIENVFVAL